MRECCSVPEKLTYDPKTNAVTDGKRVWIHKKGSPPDVDVQRLEYVEATGNVTDGQYEWHRDFSSSYRLCKAESDR